MTSHRPIHSGVLIEVATGAAGEQHLRVRSDRRLRGPYTAAGALLRHIVPDLRRVGAPELGRHSMTVSMVSPELADLVSPAPMTLTNTAPDNELTRFYGADRIREHANGITDLVLAWVGLQERPVAITVHDHAHADETDRVFTATLRRRATRAGTTVVLDDAAPVDAPERSGQDAQAYVDADGLVDLCSPAARSAYHALDDEERRRLHDRRAAQLRQDGHPGIEFGSLPYHLARGSDPGGEGVRAHRLAARTLYRRGFYHRVAELCRTGRELALDHDADSYHRFTHTLANALTYIGETDEALSLMTEERALTTEPEHHMNVAYLLAMRYTRYLPKDQQDSELALAWTNTAIALADTFPDPALRIIHRAFMRNARALVELHRGNLRGALGLVDEAIALTDSALGPDEHRLHRSVLAFNRARVLAGLGDLEAALPAIDAAVSRDDQYDELYFERAAIRLAAGDVAGALADYDETLRLRPTLVEGYHNRAALLVELGADERARADLDTALEYEPDLAEALLSRISLALDEEDWSTAERHLTHALNLTPLSADLWVAQGVLLSHRQDDEGAARALDRALELQPGSVAALGNRALLRYGAGDVPGAIADLDLAISLAPSTELLLNRSVARQDADDLDGALEDARAAYALDDSGPVVARLRELDALARASVAS